MVGLVATAPGEKNPHKAAPCEELDPPYDIKLVFVQTIASVLRKKTTKTAANRAALFDSNMHQIICPRLGLRPRPTGAACSAPPDPYLYLGGLLLMGREGRGGNERKGREAGR